MYLVLSPPNQSVNPRSTHVRKCARKSGTETCAWRRMPRSVPTATSLWFGTTQPRSMQRRMMWLPFCRTTTKPRDPSVAMIFCADVRGSLDMSHFERRNERVSVHRLRKFFHRKLGGFLQIFQSLLYGKPLAYRPCLRTLGNEDPLLLMDDSSKHNCIVSHIV